MTLHLHRAARTDVLAAALGDLLARPLDDPFASELVLVPAKGVERWLSQRLSHRLGTGAGGDGVCAGVQFRSPGSLIAELTGTTSDDPWAPDAMVWPLLEVIDQSLDEDWCHTLATHLGHFDQGLEASPPPTQSWPVSRRGRIWRIELSSRSTKGGVWRPCLSLKRQRASSSYDWPGLPCRERWRCSC